MWWNDYVGIPFVEKGRDRKGLDCWGLVRLIYKDVKGVELPSWEEAYNSTKDKHVIAGLLAEGQKEASWLKVEAPESFDVLVLKIAGVPFHVGLYTHQKRFIHCSRDTNTSIERLDSLRWRNNLLGAFRWVS